jgi:uncharacterized HhH-GPD family protein
MIEIVSCTELSEFSFRWPDATEEFERGWECQVRTDGQTHAMRHGIGSRVVYGRLRLHTVTWLAGQPQVEGVEADDYPASQCLISRLRRTGRATARTWEQVPAGYEDFDIVEHRVEIDAPHSPACLAVKLREDDLIGWATHALLRSRLPRKPAGSSTSTIRTATARPPARVPEAPPANGAAVAEALLAHGSALAEALKGGVVFTPDPAANRFVSDDPFAFLAAVIADMGIKAERAWALPFQLQERLGRFTPEWIGTHPAAVRDAVQQAPKLHRFVNVIPGWLSQAGRIIKEQYGGDASNLWNDQPSAAQLRSRLEAFPGVGQKKAAMAVEILARDLHKPIKLLEGNDVAYDVQLRRVFLRTGLIEADDVQKMIAVARALHPERPGALDFPAWDIGRRWCHPRTPLCPTCPLLGACPRLIERGDVVKGV